MLISFLGLVPTIFAGRWPPSFHYADARGLATCLDLVIKGNQVERIPMPLDAASVSVIKCAESGGRDRLALH